MASDIASIGIAIDTAGLEKGAVALDALASKGADVDRAMSQVEGATARAKKSLDTLGQGAKSASGMGELSKDAADAAVAIKGMGDASDKASGGLKSWASNMLGMGNAAKQAAAEQERLIGMMRDVYTSGTAQEQGYIKALADRVNQMRLSGAEQEKYIARSKGMSDATQELAGALRTQLDAAKNNERGLLGLGGHIEALAKKAAVAAGAFVSVNRIMDSAQQWTDMGNRLKQVTDGLDGLARAQSEVVRIAGATRSDLGATAELYQRIATHQDALGLSSQRLSGVIETISKAMQLSGVSAGAAQAALVQLGQAFASGTLRGDELNSILEQSPALAKAFSDGLGVTVGELRKLGAEGALTSEKLIGALESQAAGINDQFAKMAPTIGQSLTAVNNAFTVFVGKMDETTGLTAKMADGLSFVAKHFDAIAVAAGAVAGIGIATWAAGAISSMGGLAAVAAAAANGLIGVSLALVGTPIGQAILLIGGLTAAYIAFKDELEGTGHLAIGIGDILSEVFGKASDEIAGAGNANKDAAEATAGWWEKGLMAVAQTWDMLASIIPATATGIGRAIVNVASVITDAFSKAFNWVIENAERVTNSVIRGMNAVTRFIPMVGALDKVSFGRSNVSGVKLDVGGEFARGFAGATLTDAEDWMRGKFSNIRTRRNDRANRESSNEYGYDSRKKEAQSIKEVAEAEALLTKIRMEQSGVNQKYFDRLSELQALREKGLVGDGGVMTEKEYVEITKKLAEETWKSSAAGKADAESKKGRAKASDEAAKAAEREAKAFDTFMNSLREKIAAQELELQYGDKLTESDKKRLELEKQVANGRFKLTEARKAEANADLQIMRSNEQELANRKKLIEVIDAQRNSLMEIAKAEAARIDAMGADNSKLRDEIELIGLSSEAQAQLAIAKNNTAIAAKEEQLARLQNANITTREMSALEEEIRVLRERNELLGAKGIRQAQEEARQEAKKTADQINQSLTDALLRGFESGKDFAKNLRDTVVNMFKTMVLRPVVSAIVSPVAGMITGAMGLSGAANAGQSALSTIGTGASIFNAGSALGGLGAVGGAIFGNSLAYSAMVPGLTSAAAGSQAAMLAAQTGQFGMAGATATAQAGGATMGGFSSLLTNPVTIGLGVVAALAMSGAFSRKHEQHNLQGTFGGASGFEGKWHDYYRGGLLTSSKTDDLPIDSATLNALRAAWKAQEAAVTDYAQTLGLATDKISGFTYAINLKLMDLGDPNAEGYMAKVMQRVNEALAAGSDELAQQILGTWTETTETVKQTIWTLIGGDAGWANVTTESTQTTRTYAQSQYQREGEKAIDTLTRLATSLKTVNGVFDTLGLTMMETSLAGGDLASKLVDQFGGKDAFAALTSSYYDAYYSDAEKHATLQRQLTEQMAKLGQTLPTTRDEFRALIEAQDLSTDAGQKMFAALMALNPAFAQLTETAQAASPAVQSAADLLKRQNELLADQARLQADLMAARGDTTGAAAARRALDTEGYSDAERAIYDANQALSEQIELEKQRLELLRQQQAIQADLMAARGDSAGAQALRRELATVGFSDTAKAIYDANTALTAQIDLEKQRLDLLRQQQSIQADLMETAGDIAGAQALRRELATVGFSEAALAIYDANQALRDQIAAIQQFSGIVGGIGSSLASLIQDGLLGNLSAADLGGRMADVVIGGVYNAMASGFSQQITSLLMNGLVTPMVQAALVGTSVSEAVSRAAIDKMMAQATAVAQALGAVLSDPAFRAAMAQVEGIMSGLAAAMAPAQAYYVNWDTRQQEAQRAAQEAQRLADQQAQEAQRLAQQAAQEAQRAADEEARRQQGIMNERMGLTKQLLQLEGNTVLLRQIELEALDPSNRALQQRIWAIEDETAAAEKYKSALKDAQDFLGGFTKNIEEFIFKVSHAQADAQQSYQMAAAKFTAQMTLARGGDRDAMNGITGYADTLIGSIRRESTTGAEANLRIARVLGQLASLPKQVSAEQLIVDAIVNANTSLETVLSTNFASLDANVDGLLTAGELAASGLATNTQISALMARVDANGDGMISKQDLANSRLQTLATAQGTTNTSLGSITSAQDSTNSWLSQIQMADVGYSLSNVNAINSSTSATVAAINKTNAQIGTFNRNYDNPVTAQFSADSPLYSIFKGIDETNTWLYKLHGLSTASIQFWIALLNNNAPVTVRSENRTPANGTVFGDGGYTGPGAKWEPAGVVHKGEVVWSQADVARWGGPGIVDALRQGAPGYADGGPVAVRVPQIYVPPVGRSNEETQALLREVLAELRAQRSDDRARHGSLAEPLQRMDRRGAKWDQDGLPEARTNEAIA